MVGPRLPSIAHVLQDPQTVWQRLTLDWYGEGKRAVELCTGTACRYRFGSTSSPIRSYAHPGSGGKTARQAAKALFSTDQTQSAEEIVGDCMKRWSMEATFEESRAHLGIETQRHWSDLAVERTTPVLLGLYSLVALFGHALAPQGHLDTFPSSKLLGIINRWLPLAMSWPSCGGTFGAIFFFPHRPRTPMSLYYHVRHSRSWPMRCVTELNRTKSS